MGLDVKEIQVCIHRVVSCFVTSSCTFLKKYPVVLGILLVFFILYMFLPSLFIFLIYVLPILIFIVVSFRLIFKIHQQNLINAKGDKKNLEMISQKPSSVKDVPSVDKRLNSSKHRLSVRRRNVRERDKQVYVQQEGVEEKDMVFRTISNDALVDKTALVEECPKEIQEGKVDSVADRAECSSVASQRLSPECGNGFERTKKFNGGGGELEGESSEDDRKNLMDLGISEVETNRRLEGLIARRRARKLLSMQVRRTLMNLGNNELRAQIPSIMIPRVNPFLPNNPGGVQASPIPGSAPSVLLPMHNPFDLPYDPQEEKPNLTDDSFEEEFIGAPQKDAMFCRHESFSLGAHFPGPGEFEQSRNETFYRHNFASRQRTPEIPKYSGLRDQSGNEEASLPIQIESCQESKPVLHVDSSQDNTRQEGQEGEPVLHINSSHDNAIHEGQASEQVFDLVDIHHEENKSEVQTEPNLVREVSSGSSSSSSSELNVPFTIANKNEILKSLSFSFHKNVVIERENNDKKDELLQDCSPSSLEKEREERFFFANKRAIHTRTHSLASDLQVEVSEVGSPSLTINGSDGESLMYDGDGDMEKESTYGSEEMWVASSTLSRVEENESRLRELHEVSDQDIIEVGFSRINLKYEDPVESNVLPEGPEVVIEHDFENSSVSSSKTELPLGSQTHSTDFFGKVHDEFQPANASYSSDASLAESLAFITLEKAQQSTEKSEVPPPPYVNSHKPEEQSSYSLENSTQKESDNIEGEFQIEHNHNVEGSNLIGNMHGEEGKTDAGSSRVNQDSNYTIAPVMQRQIVAEHGPNNSSSSPSSTFMTEEMVLDSFVSLPNFDKKTQIESQQFGADMVDNNFLDKQLPESATPTVPQDRDPEKPLEPTTELNIIYNVNDPEVSVNHDMGNLKIIDDRDIKEMISKPIVSNEDQFKRQGESYKPVEETNNSMSSKGLEEEPEKLAEYEDRVAPSRPIEKMDIRESSQDSEFEQGVVDVGFSTVSQSFNDPNLSAMLPEVVVEQVPLVLCVSSSSKSETQKMVSVDPKSSLNVDSEMHLNVQKSDEEMVEDKSLDELLPENLSPTTPPKALHLSSDSTAYPSINKNLEELQEPSNPPMKSSQELNLIYNVKDSEDPVYDHDDVKTSKTTDDIHGEACMLVTEENVGVLSNISEESRSKSIDEYIEGQSSKGGENQTILESYKPFEKNGHLKVSKDFEGECLKLNECNNIVETSNLVGSNDILESQECEQETVAVGITEVSPSTDGPVTRPGTAESELSGLNQSFINDFSPPVVLPEGVVDQVHIASNLASSPNFVSEKKFSIGQASIPSCNQEIHTEVQQDETEMEENDISGLPNENLTATASDNALHLMEDSTTLPNQSRHSGNLQEASKVDPGRSIFEADIISNENDLVVNMVLGEEDLRSDVGDTERDSQRLTKPVAIAEQSDIAEVADPISIKNIEGNSKKLTEAEAMVGSLQPEVKNDRLTDNKDTKETIELINH